MHVSIGDLLRYHEAHIGPNAPPIVAPLDPVKAFLVPANTEIDLSNIIVDAETLDVYLNNASDSETEYAKTQRAHRRKFESEVKEKGLKRENISLTPTTPMNY
jgi:hypothetical protein